MRKVLLTTAALALSIGTANAQKMGKGGTGVDETSEVPKCVQPFGTMAIVEKRSAASPADGLPPQIAAMMRMAEAQQNGGQTRVDPIPLLKLLAANSNCFLIVDRGEGFDALQREREMAGSTTAGAKANTLRAADYLLTATVVYSDGNAGGYGGGVAGMFGGGMGFKSKKLEAQVMLALVEVSTGIQRAIASGQVRKKDLSIIGGGVLLNAGIGALGGSYTSTDMGKITSLALLDAYRKLTSDAKVRLAPPAAAAPAPVPAGATATPGQQ